VLGSEYNNPAMGKPGKKPGWFSEASRDSKSARGREERRSMARKKKTATKDRKE